MKFLTTLIACCAIAALTTDVGAAEGIQIKSKGFQLRMVPDDRDAISSTSVATATCDVKIKRLDVLLHWSTSPFAHVIQPELVSDAVISANVLRQRGNIFVSPDAAIDRTDIAAGNDTAAVAMEMRGNGNASVRLKVGIDNPQAAAGRHAATVVLTVIGP